MNKWKRWASLSLLFLLFVQCNKCKETVDPPEPEQPTQYTFQWNVVFGNNDLVQGQTYNHIDGYRLLLEDFRGYVSDITLYDENDSAHVIQDIALLNWFNDPQLTIKADPRTVKRIGFSLGVPSSINTNTDPTTYPNSSPLSVGGAAGMFWTWNTGYIFYQLNGKTDLTGSTTAPLIDPIAYHCGDDILFREIIFDVPDVAVTRGQTQTWQIKLDAQKCFWNDQDTLHLATDYLTHTTGNLPLAIRAMNLYGSAFEWVP
jgi:hypothetical protein